MDYEQVLKQHRKKVLCSAAGLSAQLSCGREEIKLIIPHREPFLLIDRITAIDLEQGIITGSRFLSPDDPVFKGHFPDYPVYPGALQLEMAGQLGLCLHYFLSNKTTSIKPDKKPLAIRATRILGAHFILPLLPGSEALIIAKKLDFDQFFGTMLGQVVSEGRVCSVCISEVCFLE
jgi:3-hydroxyacyl-[acyl-carrier-protein] dehydratase